MGEPGQNLTQYDDDEPGQHGRPKPQPGDPQEGGEDKGGAMGKLLGSSELDDAEKASAIGGLYKAAGIDPASTDEGGNKLVARLRGINRRRKILAGAGIGGVVGLLMSVMVVMPLYRIPAMLTNIQNLVGQEADDIVDHIAERMIIDYLLAKAGANTTDYVVTGSPLSDLWRTFQSRRIEKQIYEKTGIRFRKIGNVVHLEHDGRDLGKIRNYEEVQALIDKGTISTKKEFRTIIKAVLPIYRFHKASIEAKSFKNRFLRGNPFGAPPANEDKTKTPAENAAKQAEELATQEIEQGTASTLDSLGNALTCTISGEGCDEFKQQDPDATVPDPESETAKRAAANKTVDEVMDEVSEAKDEAKREAIKDPQGGFLTRLLEKILAKVIGAAAAKTAVGAIPWIGWIDTAATIQHAIGTAIANGLTYRIPIIMKENAYGAIYTMWVGYSDQQKAGKMAISQIVALNKQLSGSEKGELYHLIYDNKAGYGVRVDPKVDDDISYIGNEWMDHTYNSFFGRWVIRLPLEGWYKTVGALLRLGGSGVVNFISWLLKITGFTAAWEKFLVSLFGENWKMGLAKAAVKIIMGIYGIIVDPLSKGAKLFNNIVVGGAVALNYHCKNFLGCRALTPLQSVFVGEHLQKERAEDMAMTPLKDRLFSTEIPSSLTSTLIRQAPDDASPGSVIAAIFNQVARLPSSLATAFSPRARAASYQQLSDAIGMQWWGALPSDLDQDIPAELRTTKTEDVECPKTDPQKEFNYCQAGQTVIHSMSCYLEPEKCPEWQ